MLKKWLDFVKQNQFWFNSNFRHMFKIIIWLPVVLFMHKLIKTFLQYVNKLLKDSFSVLKDLMILPVPGPDVLNHRIYMVSGLDFHCCMLCCYSYQKQALGWSFINDKLQYFSFMWYIPYADDSLHVSHCILDTILRLKKDLNHSQAWNIFLSLWNVDAWRLVH